MAAWLCSLPRALEHMPLAPACPLVLWLVVPVNNSTLELCQFVAEHGQNLDTVAKTSRHKAPLECRLQPGVSRGRGRSKGLLCALVVTLRGSVTSCDRPCDPGQLYLRTCDVLSLCQGLVASF